MNPVMQRWSLDQFGRQHLRLNDAPVPNPKAGEVLIEVKAIALNYRDRLMIDNGLGLPLTFPFVPGSDMAGRIVALGAGVGDRQIGERVIAAFTPEWVDGVNRGPDGLTGYPSLGGTLPGTLTPYLALPADWLVSLPDQLDDQTAATLPCAGLTAWFALVERGAIRPGQRVLIHGTGGVALFALAIAKAQGAEVLITTTSPAKIARLTALGADHVIDRTADDWGTAVQHLTGGRGADHIIETIGGHHLGQSLNAVARGGRISLIGVLDGFDISGSAGPLMLKDVTIQGIAVGHRRALGDLVTAIAQGKITPVIEKAYHFDDLPAALAHLDRGPFGKIILIR